jgi:hypothetical protein
VTVASSCHCAASAPAQQQALKHTCIWPLCALCNGYLPSSLVPTARPKPCAGSSLGGEDTLLSTVLCRLSCKLLPVALLLKAAMPKVKTVGSEACWRLVGLFSLRISLSTARTCSRSRSSSAGSPAGCTSNDCAAGRSAPPGSAGCMFARCSFSAAGRCAWKVGLCGGLLLLLAAWVVLLGLAAMLTGAGLGMCSFSRLQPQVVISLLLANAKVTIPPCSHDWVCGCVRVRETRHRLQHAAASWGPTAGQCLESMLGAHWLLHDDLHRKSANQGMVAL